MISIIVVAVSLIFLSAYKIYGRFLSNQLGLDDSIITPACRINDGKDFVPAKRSLLLGQHFSAIAAAGPIVGPILAGIWFGWLPTLLWIILGSIFIGGVYDFVSLAASIKHEAASIGHIVKKHMSRTAHILFLIFIWFALIYVITVFTDITAQTFKTASDEMAFGPGVAASSVIYLFLGIIMGILLYKFNLNLSWTTAVFIPLVLLSVWVGPRLPSQILSFFEQISVKEWDIVILLYCFIASVIPVWLLLQPRGYLGGWLLYITIIIGFIGALFGGFETKYPAVNIDGFKSILNGKSLFPILFITVACGACSGFHGIVSSGTTSKQIEKESDAKLIGYGGMLLEGIVAVLALITVMILPQGSMILKDDPNLIYAKGISEYLKPMGIPFNIAFPFALLAFSTFVYDTLDVSTRLARYILQELFGWEGNIGILLASIFTLLPPAIFLMLSKEKGYLVAWPIFGTSNQLLASLTLLAISLWLKKNGKNALYTLIPMVFMLGITIWSLILLILPFITSLSQISEMKTDTIISGVCGIILFILSLILISESIKILRIPKIQ